MISSGVTIRSGQLGQWILWFLIASIVSCVLASQAICAVAKQHSLVEGYDATAFPGIDPTGNSDSTAGVEAAYAFAPYLTFPCGTYRMNATLTGLASFSMSGQPGCTIFVPNADGSPVIRFVRSNFGLIQNLIIRNDRNFSSNKLDGLELLRLGQHCPEEYSGKRCSGNRRTL